MLTCSICNERYPYHAPCDRSHEGLCHWCAEANMASPLDTPAHPAPRDPPPPALTPREREAVAAYTRHVVAVWGTGPLVDLVTEEET